MNSPKRGLCAVVALAIVIAGCGDDSGSSPFGGAQPDAGAAESDNDDDLGAAFGVGGGGGTLTFDGEQIEIASATCILDDNSYDSGTVSDNGFRVFATQRSIDDKPSAQILDSGNIQWFPDGDDVVVRSGNTISSPPLTYFNNSDDRRIEASFDIECP